MKRRTLVLGLGSIGLASSSILGSGAFSSVRADRDVTVNVAGDADAYLRLAPCEGSANGDYVTGAADGTMAIDLSSENDDVEGDGEGVNPEALTVIHNVFEISNQGTQNVCVDFEIDVPEIPGDVPDRYDFVQGDPAVVFYRADDQDEKVTVDELNPDRPGAISLETGARQCIGLEIRAFGFSSDESIFDDAELTIHAEAGAACEETTVDPSRDPDDIDGLAGWFDATEVETDDGEVETWPDQTDNDNDLSPTEGTATLDGDAFPAGPGVTFDGETVLTRDEPEGLDASELTIFTLFEADDDPSDEIGVLHTKQGSEGFLNRNWWHALDNGQGFAGGDGQLGFRTSSDGEIDLTLIAEDDEDDGYIDDTPYLSSARVSADGDNAELRVDGVREDEEIGDIGEPDTDNQLLAIGAQNEESGTDSFHRFFEGSIAEVIIYDRMLSPEEREDVEAYVADKYGLEL